VKYFAIGDRDTGIVVTIGIPDEQAKTIANDYSGKQIQEVNDNIPYLYNGRGEMVPAQGVDRNTSGIRMPTA